jgi:hypothetical protein
MTGRLGQQFGKFRLTHLLRRRNFAAIYLELNICRMK